MANRQGERGRDMGYTKVSNLRRKGAQARKGTRVKLSFQVPRVLNEDN